VRERALPLLQVLITKRRYRATGLPPARERRKYVRERRNNCESDENNCESDERDGGGVVGKVEAEAVGIMKNQPKKKKRRIIDAPLKFISRFRLFSLMWYHINSACNKNARLLSVRYEYRFFALPPFNPVF